MNRVAIVGACGSGKSYVARELGRILQAPVTHLDVIYYDEVWNALSQQEFEAVQRELVSAPCWIIDGNYNGTLEIRLRACDTVVMMDVSTWTALRGLLFRQARHGAGQHASGVYNRITWDVIAYVLGYRRRMRPRVVAKIREFAVGKDVVFLTDRARTRRWLEEVASKRSEQLDR
ncbi:topology modulation protein [Nonomuraea sp. NPDC005650]|uniref:topology modulation protein n=1 Tax=Nonomuraea sp. NPDC005650 TaxID=3157045 RepID=UPI0033B0BC01